MPQDAPTQSEIRDRIKKIAGAIEYGKNQEKPCVLLLGAGASISSGVPATAEIATDILNKLKWPIRGELWDEWERAWNQLDPDKRERLLQPYLEPSTISLGYTWLAKLIRKHYFTTIITLNFDRLLAKGLREEGLQRDTDFGLLSRSGAETDQEIVKAMGRDSPPVKILQMHAGLGSMGTLLFSRKDMVSYPPPIFEFLKRVTQGEILMIGCAFKDICLITAFSNQGGPVYCVNPSPPTEYLADLIFSRKSEAFVIKGEYGKFDDFVSELYSELLGNGSHVSPKPPRFNPFKFLGSYGPNDRKLFFGRDDERDDVTERLSKPESQVFHLLGVPKSGKTSFIRAGLLPHLAERGMQSIYLHCPRFRQETLDTWLPAELAKASSINMQPIPGLENVIREVATNASKQDKKELLLVLDDFDRLLPRDGETKDVVALLRRLAGMAGTYENAKLRFLCVWAADSLDKTMMCQQVTFTTNQTLYPFVPFPKKQVKTIIAEVTGQAGINFAPEVVEAIVEEYPENGTPDRPRQFTLAHVQALCHLLADRTQVDMGQYTSVWANQGLYLTDALSINFEEFFSFLEAIPDEGRKLLQKVLKHIYHEGKRFLANCVQDQSFQKDMFLPEVSSEAVPPEGKQEA